MTTTQLLDILKSNQDISFEDLFPENTVHFNRVTEQRREKSIAI